MKESPIPDWQYGEHQVLLPENVVKSIVDEHFSALVQHMVDNSMFFIGIGDDPLRIDVDFDLDREDLVFKTDLRTLLRKALEQDGGPRSLYGELLRVIDQFDSGSHAV